MQDDDVRRQRTSGDAFLSALIGSLIGSTIATLTVGAACYFLMLARLWETHR